MKRKLTLKKALQLEEDRLSRKVIAALRRKGRDAWKYQDKKK